MGNLLHCCKNMFKDSITDVFFIPSVAHSNLFADLHVSTQKTSIPGDFYYRVTLNNCTPMTANMNCRRKVTSTIL